jgi:hypothetical protein
MMRPLLIQVNKFSAFVQFALAGAAATAAIALAPAAQAAQEIAMTAEVRSRAL